jgi:hypothetical protein
MGHQITYLGAGEVGSGEGLKMIKEAASECLSIRRAAPKREYLQTYRKPPMPNAMRKISNP